MPVFVRIKNSELAVQEVLTATNLVCQPAKVTASEGIFRNDLALVHHRGFGFHAAACAPGILDYLAPVLAQGGLVLELGCGTGLLTKELVGAGHRVLATDASLAMLAVARTVVGGSVQDIRRITLPDDPLPLADAVVAVGHPLNYLPNADAIERALVAIARALRPGGLLAIDVCDLEWGRIRSDTAQFAAVDEDWAIITKFSMPNPELFVRDITTFLPNADGSWRRDREHHENVLVDVGQIPGLLQGHGVEAQVGLSFGTETNPAGLRVILGHKRSASP